MTLSTCHSRTRLTLVDVALDHDTHNAGLALGNLASKVCSDLGLILVVLQRVAVAAVDHEPLGEASLLQRSLRLSDALGIVVGALRTTSQNDEAVLIAHGAHNSDDARLGNRKEVVGVSDGTNGVDRDSEGAVGAVLETNGETETTGQLSVQLALGGSRTDSADRQQISKELGRDRIEHLAGNGHALVRQVDEQLSRQTQALVDLEAVVDIGVVDQTLPSHSRARLLQVGAHHDEQLILMLLLGGEEQVAVLERGLGVVDGAGANDDQEPLLLVGAIDNGSGLLATVDDCLLRLGRLGNLVLEQIGRSQRVVAAN